MNLTNRQLTDFTGRQLLSERPEVWLRVRLPTLVTAPERPFELPAEVLQKNLHLRLILIKSGG
eukprot:1510574-Amphidinium_carterae.1